MLVVERESSHSSDSPNVNEPHNWLSKEQHKRTAQVLLDDLTCRYLVVVLAPPSRIARLLSHLRRLALQYRRSISFLDGEHHSKCATSEDQDDPVGPTPTHVFKNEPSDEWPQNRAVKGTKTEERHAKSHLLWLRHVDNGSRTVGNEGGTKKGTGRC